MKNNPGAGSFDLPSAEAENCSYIRRNSDIAIGPAAELFFHMQYVGHYVCRKGFHIRRQIDPTAILLLTLSGEGVLLYDGGRYRLGRGACMFIEAGRPHEYFPVSDGWEFKFIHFRGCMTPEYLGYAASRFGPVRWLGEAGTERIDSLLTRVLEKTECDVIDDYPGISGDIYSMIIALLSASAADPGAGEQLISPAMARAAQFIRRNSGRSVSTGEIAAEVNMSRPHMSKLFKTTYGIPPHEYLNSYRVSSAKSLLVTTSLSVTEIAERTGFRDLFSFSRIFRRMTGISPTEYRERYRV